MCVSQLYFCHRLGSRLDDFSAIGSLGYLIDVGESLSINQDGIRKESPLTMTVDSQKTQLDKGAPCPYILIPPHITFSHLWSQTVRVTWSPRVTTEKLLHFHSPEMYPERRGGNLYTSDGNRKPFGDSPYWEFCTILLVSSFRSLVCYYFLMTGDF